ncbi:MAG: hypothetical protein Q9175_002388 [Cornicularia normoerica]
MQALHAATSNSSEFVDNCPENDLKSQRDSILAEEVVGYAMSAYTDPTPGSSSLSYSLQNDDLADDLEVRYVIDVGCK